MGTGTTHPQRRGRWHWHIYLPTRQGHWVRSPHHPAYATATAAQAQADSVRTYAGDCAEHICQPVDWLT